jgi:hypothetical protein
MINFGIKDENIPIANFGVPGTEDLDLGLGCYVQFLG